MVVCQLLGLAKVHCRTVCPYVDWLGAGLAALESSPSMGDARSIVQSWALKADKTDRYINSVPLSRHFPCVLGFVAWATLGSKCWGVGLVLRSELGVHKSCSRSIRCLTF